MARRYDDFLAIILLAHDAPERAFPARHPSRSSSGDVRLPKIRRAYRRLMRPVSYIHLDVYKRQPFHQLFCGGCLANMQYLFGDVADL